VENSNFEVRLVARVELVEGAEHIKRIPATYEIIIEYSR
jgi:hypothetical protein